MTEAQIRPSKTRVAGLHARNAHFAFLVQHVARAKIFSASVIGRRVVAIGGRNTFFCILATLKGNNPPYSIT